MLPLRDKGESDLASVPGVPRPRISCPGVTIRFSPDKGLMLTVCIRTALSLQAPPALSLSKLLSKQRRDKPGEVPQRAYVLVGEKENKQ